MADQALKDAGYPKRFRNGEAQTGLWIFPGAVTTTNRWGF